jgi:hypothetical protein
MKNLFFNKLGVTNLKHFNLSKNKISFQVNEKKFKNILIKNKNGLSPILNVSDKLYFLNQNIKKIKHNFNNNFLQFKKVRKFKCFFNKNLVLIKNSFKIRKKFKQLSFNIIKFFKPKFKIKNYLFFLKILFFNHYFLKFLNSKLIFKYRKLFCWNFLLNFNKFNFIKNFFFNKYNFIDYFYFYNLYVKLIKNFKENYMNFFLIYFSKVYFKLLKLYCKYQNFYKIYRIFYKYNLKMDYFKVKYFKNTFLKYLTLKKQNLINIFRFLCKSLKVKKYKFNFLNKITFKINYIWSFIKLNLLKFNKKIFLICYLVLIIKRLKNLLILKPNNKLKIFFFNILKFIKMILFFQKKTISVILFRKFFQKFNKDLNKFCYNLFLFKKAFSYNSFKSLKKILNTIYILKNLITNEFKSFNFFKFSKYKKFLHFKFKKKNKKKKKVKIITEKKSLKTFLIVLRKEKKKILYLRKKKKSLLIKNFILYLYKKYKKFFFLNKYKKDKYNLNKYKKNKYKLNKYKKNYIFNKSNKYQNREKYSYFFFNKKKQIKKIQKNLKKRKLKIILQKKRKKNLILLKQFINLKKNKKKEIFKNFFLYHKINRKLKKLRFYKKKISKKTLYYLKKKLILYLSKIKKFKFKKLFNNFFFRLKLDYFKNINKILKLQLSKKKKIYDKKNSNLLIKKKIVKMNIILKKKILKNKINYLKYIIFKPEIFSYFTKNPILQTKLNKNLFYGYFIENLVIYNKTVNSNLHKNLRLFFCFNK